MCFRYFIESQYFKILQILTLDTWMGLKTSGLCNGTKRPVLLSNTNSPLLLQNRVKVHFIQDINDIKSSESYISLLSMWNFDNLGD